MPPQRIARGRDSGPSIYHHVSHPNGLVTRTIPSQYLIGLFLRNISYDSYTDTVNFGSTDCARIRYGHLGLHHITLSHSSGFELALRRTKRMALILTVVITSHHIQVARVLGPRLLSTTR